MKKLILALLFLPSLAIAQVGPVRWRVDANISGANPSLGTSAVTVYTGITDGSLTLTNNAGTGTKVITAQIPCSTTVTPSGTTCSSGTESIGVAFTPPGGWKGDAIACFSFVHRIQDTSSATNMALTSTFQLVETPNNAQTISQEGKTRLSSEFINNSGGGGEVNNVTRGFRLCGTFTFATSGQKVIRLFYEQSVSGSNFTSTIFADADTNNGQRDIHIEVYPLNN